MRPFDGGERAAAIYTLVGTAKINDLNPEAYLRYVLERMLTTRSIALKSSCRGTLLASHSVLAWQHRQKMRVRKLLVFIATVLVVLGLMIPWGLYALGLSNVVGRPSEVADKPINSEDDAILRRELRAQCGISVVPLSPLSYFFNLMLTNSTASAEESGADAASLVARNYNASHLKNRQSLWWHLSGASLTIWITRNWTPSQVLSKAAEIAKQRSLPTR